MISYTILFLDDPCVRSNGENGICIKLSACTFAREQVRNNISPGTCGFEKKHPLVCCPLEGVKSKKSKYN